MSVPLLRMSQYHHKGQRRSSMPTCFNPFTAFLSRHTVQENSTSQLGQCSSFSTDAEMCHARRPMLLFYNHLYTFSSSLTQTASPSSALTNGSCVSSPSIKSITFPSSVVSVHSVVWNCNHLLAKIQSVNSNGKD